MSNKRRARIRRGLKTKALQSRNTKPRLVVYRSCKHIYGQLVIHEENGDRVLVSASTLGLKSNPKSNKLEQAKEVGKLLGERAKANEKIDLGDISFDRAGYKYHGRVQALAEGAREAGLKF